MPNLTNFPIRVQVIEGHEGARKYVFVGSDLLAEDCQIGIAVSFAKIAKHLIEGAVLLIT